MRKFESGATRDTDEGKLSYYKALSPRVIQRYVQYLGANRKQADGNMRDWDNWKRGIDQEVYADSLVRHVQAMELLDEGFVEVTDNHGVVNLEETLCAIMFNAMGRLFEVLKETDNENIS